LSSMFNAQAQGSKAATYPTMIEISQAKALWFNSTNAAGMILTPMTNYNILSVGYDIKNGEYRLQQEGDRNNLNINTAGARSLGNARVWGEFTYQNSTIKDTRYNTILLEPRYDMPYYIADPNLSYWKRQTYEMSVKGASPILWDLVGFGVSANYFTKVGAKQIDPRCTSFKYGISVIPSAVFTFGEKHSAGISFTYVNSFERTSPTNSNNQQEQSAYLMKGLGNYADGVVGSLNSLGTYYYKENKIGAALQYGFNGDSFDVLAEAKNTYQVIDVMQSPTKPQRMGSTVQKITGGNIQAIINPEGDLTGKITLDGYRKNTDGIEYIQEIDKSYEVQQWVTIAKYIRSTYQFTAASLKYDLYRNSDAGYNWMAGIQGIYSNRADEYIVPNSTFKAENIYGEIYGKKNIMAGDNSILIGINAGYNYNLNGSYSYNGSNPESRVVKDMYEKDLAVMSANYYQFGVNINASFPIWKGTSLYVAGNCQYLRSTDTMNQYAYVVDKDGSNFRWNIKDDSSLKPSQRVIATISIGFTF